MPVAVVTNRSTDLRDEMDRNRYKELPKLNHPDQVKPGDLLYIYRDSLNVGDWWGLVLTLPIQEDQNIKCEMWVLTDGVAGRAPYKHTCYIRGVRIASKLVSSVDDSLERTSDSLNPWL